MDTHAPLIREMIQYEEDCPQRVHHFLKVLGFAQAIAALEGLDETTTFILEAAAIVHDIGIRPSLEKHGSAAGPLQELEGPPAAREMLARLGYDGPDIERVCQLVGRHHTYTDVDGLDCRILLEADFLVNIYEGNISRKAAFSVLENVFRTKAGIEFFHAMYDGLTDEGTSKDER